MGAIETARTTGEPGAKGVGWGWTPTWLRAALTHHRRFALARWVAVASLVGCTAPLTVDRADDVLEASDCIDGVPNDCSLRGAIFAANQRPGPDEIVLPGLGPTGPGEPFRSNEYALTLSGPDEDSARIGDLDITDALEIEGAPFVDPATGQSFRPVIGYREGLVDRLVHVDPNGSGIAVSIRHVELRGGSASSAQGLRNGGGIANTGGDLTLDDVRFTVDLEWTYGVAGGAIFNSGALRVTNSSISQGNAIYGGGIANGDPDTGAPGATVVIEDSEIANNEASHRDEVGLGGGLFNAAGGTMVLRRSNVHDNWAPSDIFTESAGAGIANQGNLVVEDSTIHSNSGAVFLRSITSPCGFGHGLTNWGSAALTNVTLSDNAGDCAPGLPLYFDSVFNLGSLILQNVTIAESSPAPVVTNALGTIEAVNTVIVGSCFGNGFASAGGNLESPGATCDLDQPSDQSGVASPLLLALAPNGGPTPTHALAKGSPAIDAGLAAGCPTTDQRGAPRTDGHCDAGAFERQAGDP